MSRERAGRSKVDRLLAAEDPPEVIERGVSLVFLSKLLHKQNLGGELTTRQVVEQYIIPQTVNSRCSLSGLVRVIRPQSVGRATHYVIHAWDGSFQRLVEALAVIDARYIYETAGDTAYFWLDLFALNQPEQKVRHRLDEEQRWIQRDTLFLELKALQRQIDHVCVVCDPVRQPLVLSRKWCLFECAQAVSLKKELEICAVPEPPDGLDAFRELLDQGALFDRSFYRVDFASALAQSALDSEWLHHEILSLSPLGAAFVNETVEQRFLGWSASRLADRVLAPAFLDSDDAHSQELESKRVLAMHELSSILARTGNAELAREILQRAKLRAERIWGEEEEPTLQMLHDYACLIAKQFKELKPAEVILRKVLQSRRRANNKDAREEEQNAMQTMEALGLVLKERRKLTEAISLFRQVVAWKEANWGRANAETIKSLNHLALTLQKKELYAEAELVFKRVVQDGMDLLGQQHLDVLIYSNNLSMLYQDTNQLEKAEILLRNTLRNCESALGPTHEHTLILLFNLGYVLWLQGRTRPAEKMFLRELAACEATKGADHRDTIRSRQNLERFLAATRTKQSSPSPSSSSEEGEEGSAATAAAASSTSANASLADDEDDDDLVDESSAFEKQTAGEGSDDEEEEDTFSSEVEEFDDFEQGLSE